VITFDEAYVELVAGIGEGLGVPSLGRQAARLCRDKYAMRRQFSRAGIPSAMCAIARTADEAMSASSRSPLAGWSRSAASPRSSSGSRRSSRRSGTSRARYG
jgi:biotin carboxylase